MTETNDRRQAGIDSIRRLADFIEQHPDLPTLIWSIHPDLPLELAGVVPMRHHTPRADVEAWAESLGSEVAVTTLPDREELAVKGCAGGLAFTVVGAVYPWQEQPTAGQAPPAQNGGAER